MHCPHNGVRLRTGVDWATKDREKEIGHAAKPHRWLGNESRNSRAHRGASPWCFR